jgi:hypothetical protein
VCARTQRREERTLNENVAALVGVIAGADRGECEELERALLERRRELGMPAGGRPTDREEALSRVVEGRACGDGWLQAETRAYRRADGSVTERGPYWYFRFHEGGRQRKLYLGKTADPESALAERRGGGGRE